MISVIRNVMFILVLLIFSSPSMAGWFNWFSVDSDYAKTRYPIVLAHGMSGFDNIGLFDYWHGIPQDLTDRGAEVYLTQVSSFAASEFRGEQLLQQVEEILAITGAEKVNLIGHSHGSHSVRYVAAAIPENVASATAIGGPNKGSPVFDILVNGINASGEPIGSTVTTIVDAVGTLIGLAAGEALEQDSLAGLTAITTDGAAEFNAKYPAGISPTLCGPADHIVNGVRYYSWSSTRQLTNIFDTSDIFLKAASIGFIGTEDPQNDGLVGRCSSHLGKVIRDDYRLNHLDQVNQVFGLSNFFETDPVVIFRNHANRLKNAGL